MNLTGTRIQPFYKRVEGADLLYGLDNLSVWTWILGFSPSPGEKFCNPFRNDPSPGCYLYDYNGVILLADWGHSEFHGINFLTALQYVYPHLPTIKRFAQFKQDYIIQQNIPFQPSSVYSSPEPHPDFRFILNSTPRAWDIRDKQFWERYQITRSQLEFEDISPVYSYTHNSRKTPQRMITRIPADPTWSIHINQHEKIYRPFAQDQNKWISNLRKEDIGGKSPCNSRILFLKKSYKDYQVIVNRGHSSRFILNEGVIPHNFLKKAVQEFDLIIPLMDNDTAGKAAAAKYETYIRSIGGRACGTWLESDKKDPSDYIEKYGPTELDYQLNKIIDNAYQTYQISTKTLVATG